MSLTYEEVDIVFLYTIHDYIKEEKDFRCG